MSSTFGVNPSGAGMVQPEGAVVAQPEDLETTEETEEDILAESFSGVDGSLPAGPPAREFSDNFIAPATCIKDIRYASSGNEKHRLDIYQPPRTTTVTGEVSNLAPIYFHVHGGGWKRGDKSFQFYGAPSVCTQMSQFTGFVAVAPSYRLGNYPNCLVDVVTAFRWTIQHAGEYGGDANRIVLSGHSAGAHLASMLLLRGSEFGLTQEDYGRIRAVVLISGVYSLYAPLSHKPYWLRNVVFRRSYIRQTFGEDGEELDRASPSCVLLALGARLPTSTDSKCGGCFLGSLFSSSAKDDAPPLPTPSGGWPKMNVTVPSWLSSGTTAPAVLVLNASLDLGLEVDGLVFSKLLESCMRSHRAPTSVNQQPKHTQKNEEPVADASSTWVRYQVIPSTNHASICWRGRTGRAIASFLAECAPECVPESDVSVPSPANHHSATQ